MCKNLETQQGKNKEKKNSAMDITISEKNWSQKRLKVLSKKGDVIYFTHCGKNRNNVFSGHVFSYLLKTQVQTSLETLHTLLTFEHSYVQ